MFPSSLKFQSPWLPAYSSKVIYLARSRSASNYFFNSLWDLIVSSVILLILSCNSPIWPNIAFVDLYSLLFSLRELFIEL